MHDYKIIDKPYGAIGFQSTIASGLSFYFYLSIKVGSLGGKFLQGDFSCQFISDFYFFTKHLSSSRPTVISWKTGASFILPVPYSVVGVRGRPCVGVRAWACVRTCVRIEMEKDRRIYSYLSLVSIHAGQPGL